MKSPSTPSLLAALLLALGVGCAPSGPARDASIDAPRAMDAASDAQVDASVDADVRPDADRCVELYANCEVNPCCDDVCCGQEPAPDGGIAPWPSCVPAAPPGGFCYP